MAGVFISYRRSDVVGDADRLHERLISVFSEPDVFFDRRSLKASERFDVTLVDRLRACDVLIAVVGPNWMAMESGQPRISQRGDYVRGEIAEALGGRPIIPVLFRGAKMPTPSDLPDDIRCFALVQAHRIDEDHFDDDVRALVDKIRVHFRVPRSVWRRAFLLYRPRGMRSTWVWAGFYVTFALSIASSIAVLQGLANGFLPEVETVGAVVSAALCGGLRYMAPRSDMVRHSAIQACAVPPGGVIGPQ